jgi:hypothetical protein
VDGQNASTEPVNLWLPFDLDETALISKALGLGEEEVFPDELKHNNEIENLRPSGDTFCERMA